MYTSVIVGSLFLIVAVTGIDENQAKLRFYYDTMENYTELFIDEAHKIVTDSWYDPSRTTVVITHGFTGHPGGPAMKALVNAYIGNNNVVLLNWDKLAANIFPSILTSYMTWAAPNSIQLGADFSETLFKLSEAGLDLNNTHFIGHSLGAHIFGIAGNKMLEKGIQLPWITGLDPAIGFEMKPAFLRLRPTSARFVSVIHSDPHKFGTKKEIGYVDFWPNFRGIGPVLQPGCPNKPQRFSDEDFCSHNRAWKLLVDAIKYPGTLIGCHAKHFRAWNRYNESDKRAAKTLDIGVKDENAIPGNYFFITASESPYGLGEQGTAPDGMNNLREGIRSEGGLERIRELVSK